jgi:hypothetical protein
VSSEQLAVGSRAVGGSWQLAVDSVMIWGQLMEDVL